MRPAWLVLRKDLLVLRRSPALVAILVAYPLVIAVLIGLMAGYASSKPRVALVDLDGLPPKIRVGERVFHVDRTIDTVAENVKLVRMGSAEAKRQLASGRIVASITVPLGFTADLRSMGHSPKLLFQRTQGGIAPRVEQQVQALVYRLNRLVEDAYIDSTLQYVGLIKRGGTGSFLGNHFTILGLAGAERLLAGLPPSPERTAIRHFVAQSQTALTLTGTAMRAIANPIELVQEPSRGRTWTLSAQVQAYALGLTITFLALLLAAGAIAAERDENVIGRLARGLVRPGQLVLAKTGLAAVVAVVLGSAVALTFGVVIQAAGVTGGEPWERLPLVVVGLALAGAALGAIGSLLGVLAREARTASLVAILVVLPIVFLGLVPREVVPPAGWVSDAFPFVHAVRLFSSALYDASPWSGVGREAAWLAGLAAVFGVAARQGTSRLSA